MFEKIKNYPREKIIEQLRDPRVMGLLVFLLVVLMISWSGVKVIESNYQLQKQIAALQQQTKLQELKNNNLKLQNEYLGSNQYLDIAARQNFGLGANGEKLLLVPKAVALAKAPPVMSSTQVEAASKPKDSFITRNMKAWLNYLFDGGATTPKS